MNLSRRVARVTAAAALGAMLTVEGTGCTSGATPRPTAAYKPSGTPSTRLIAPATTLEKPENAVLGDLSAVLLERCGRGPARFPIVVPPGVRSVRAFLSCTPGSSFRVTISKAYWSGCANPFVASADIPVTTATRSVRVTVPAGTAFSLLVIRTPPPWVEPSP